MEKETKYMIIGGCATVFCFVVALVCAILSKFNVVSSVMFAIIAAFTVFVCVYVTIDLIRTCRAKKQEAAKETK